MRISSGATDSPRPLAPRAAAALLAALLCAAGTAGAAEIALTVTNQDGRALADAVVVAVPAAGAPRLAPPAKPEIVDQIDEEFVPRVKPILVGSSVFFPNKDNIRHQVYSFSAAKRFELPLYAGTPAKPIVFDRPGVVVLGCNIHDWMIGYIYVSESPYYAKTGADGRATLAALPAGRYTLRVWHARAKLPEAATSRDIELAKDGRASLAWSLALKPEIGIRRAPAGAFHRAY